MARIGYSIDSQAGRLNQRDAIEPFDALVAGVRAFASAELPALTRKVVYRLQRIQAPGIYGGDPEYKTLWDEYCHELQHGPTSLLERAWDQTLNPILSDVVDHIPHHHAVLLSVFAVWDNLSDESPLQVGQVWRDGIRDLLLGQLERVAAGRKMNRFTDR